MKKEKKEKKTTKSKEKDVEAASQSPAKAKPMSKAQINKAELEATKNRLNTMLTHTQMNFQSRQHKIKTEFEAKERELK